MKAVRVHAYGGPEVLRYEEVDEPRPGPGEAVITVYSQGQGIFKDQAARRFVRVIERRQQPPLRRAVINGAII